MKDFRIVGKFEKEGEEEKIKNRIIKHFKESIYKKIDKSLVKEFKVLSYPKRKYELEVIKKGNEILNSYFEKFGVKKQNISSKKIHIIPNEIYSKFEETEESLGVTYLDDSEILINASKTTNEFLRAGVIFHEMIHLAGFLSFKYFNGKNDNAVDDYFNPSKKYFLRRGGLEITNDFDYEIGEGIKYKFVTYYFQGLNEALVSYFAKKHSLDIVASSKLLKNKFEKLNTADNDAFIKELSKNLMVPPDDIMIIDIYSKKNRKERDVIVLPYYEQRLVLNYLMNKISEKYNKSFEEVENIFFKSYFGGQLIELAKLIEGVFGEGSFRLVGHMNNSKESAILCLNELKKREKRGV